MIKTWPDSFWHRFSIVFVSMTAVIFVMAIVTGMVRGNLVQTLLYGFGFGLVFSVMAGLSAAALARPGDPIKSLGRK